MTDRLDTITEPTAADLATVEVETGEVDWEAVLVALGDAPITAKESDEFWSDEAPEDDRWGTDGFPVWSAFR